MTGNVYKVHYENGTQEYVFAQSEQMVSDCCQGFNQLSHVAHGVRVLEGQWQDPEPAVEPKTEAQILQELLDSVPTVGSGEPQ